MARSHKKDPQFGYSPGFTWRYPHMVRQGMIEGDLWQMWMADHPAAGEEVWYDVHTPRNLDIRPPDYGDWDIGDELKWINMWEHLTVLRADIVYRNGNNYRVVELHSNPTENNLHKTMQYAQMLALHWPAFNWLQPILVSNNIRYTINLTKQFPHLITYEYGSFDSPHKLVNQHGRKCTHDIKRDPSIAAPVSRCVDTFRGKCVRWQRLYPDPCKTYTPHTETTPWANDPAI